MRHPPAGTVVHVVRSPAAATLASGGGVPLVRRSAVVVTGTNSNQTVMYTPQAQRNRFITTAAGMGGSAPPAPRLAQMASAQRTVQMSSTPATDYDFGWASS